MAGNTITLTGNLTRDPELRFTQSGFPRAQLGIAVSHFRNDRNTNERIEETSFFNIVCLGQMGENAAQCLNKGMRVVVTGRLEQRSWQTPEGEKRSVVEVIADEIGPSLRWATATVERTDRRSADGGGFEGGDRSVRPVANEPATYGTDEEPF